MMQTETTPSTFHIKSMVRSVHTRTQRYAAPAAIRRVQHILDTQQRLVPGRNLVVTKEDVERNLDHLLSLEAQGICSVHAEDGRKLDLRTLTLAGSEPIPPSPQFRQDSVENDLKPGETHHLQYAPDKGEEAPATEVAGEDPSEEAAAAAAALAPVEPGSELGVPGQPLLANPDFAPVDDASAETAEEEEATPPPQPVSPKKNKRRLPMALEGIPGASPTLRAFVQMVRMYMRDQPELNRIVRGQESTDRQIAWAVMDAVADFNGTPPFLGTSSLEDLLQRNQQALLLRMTVIGLIESVGLLQTRNHINYSNGGINVGVNDKTPMLMQWLQYYRSFTEQMKQRVKVSFNIEGILGPSNSGVFSEYWAVNATYAAY
jgi:hypothetical protein